MAQWKPIIVLMAQHAERHYPEEVVGKSTIEAYRWVFKHHPEVRIVVKAQRALGIV